jgi:peptide/nickel transport system permease protein
MRAGPPSAVPRQPRRRAGPGLAFVKAARNNVGLLVSIIILIAVFISALLAPVLAPHDPVEQDLEARLVPPFWAADGNALHLLGTDALGRDLLSRIIYGSRVSLFVGFMAVAVQGAIGVVVGLTTGYYGGRLDAVVMRLADIQLAVPFFVLAIAVMTVLGPGLRNVVLVLGITGWILYGRVVRSEALSVRERDYVEAARALGGSGPRILLKHVLPNVFSSFLVISTLEIARMIIAEASLSYLGLGVQPPTPTWGGMVADGRNWLMTSWWVSTLPGVAIFATVLAVNVIGDFLRDWLDPTLRHG